MLQKIDSAVLARFQSWGDSITERTGKTSLDAACNILLAHMIMMGSGLLIAVLITIFAFDNMSAELQGRYGQEFQVAFLLFMGGYHQYTSLPRYRNLKRAALLWRQSWERGEIPARPSIDPVAGIWQIRLISFIGCIPLTLYILYFLGFQITPDNLTEGLMAVTVIHFLIGVFLFCASNYMEAVTPRRPGTGRKRKVEQRLPEGAIAVRG